VLIDGTKTAGSTRTRDRPTNGILMPQCDAAHTWLSRPREPSKAMETCRHFRNWIPREDADELRDADPEPCELCDRLQHRSATFQQWNPKPARIARGNPLKHLAHRCDLARVGSDPKLQSLWDGVRRVMFTPLSLNLHLRKYQRPNRVGC
jgi:hypothetical protein